MGLVAWDLRIDLGHIGWDGTPKPHIKTLKNKFGTIFLTNNLSRRKYGKKGFVDMIMMGLSWFLNICYIISICKYRLYYIDPHKSQSTSLRHIKNLENTFGVIFLTSSSNIQEKLEAEGLHID